ncbi:MAG TPA: hypothetical protein VN428_05515 [Bryobacteraceae bacterium]|nr:hypothetical protein [Bryobacteraceae bacterium]
MALRAIAAGGGIVTIGVDVMANVVRLRVVDVATRRRVEAFAIERGIPPSGLIIEEVEMAYAPDLSGNRAGTLMTGTTNLRAYRSPLSGGWQIAWWDNGSSGLCTAAATLKQSTSKVFLSAAHCGQRFATTGTRFDQPTLGNRIGAEISDAAWLPANTGVCQFGTGVDCRYSDGVIGLYDIATRGALGSVGKPIVRNPAYSDPTVVTVDDLNSTFSIAGTYPYPHVGETVHHVGRTTGWQSGTVAETCTDMYRLDAPTNRNFVLLCQSRVTATSGKGDSGGPAFFFNSEMNSVTLVGMVWSGGGFEIGNNPEGNTIYSEMWISPWENISIDYPGLSIQ